MTNQENITKVLKLVDEIVLKSQKSIYVMIDGDRTLIPNDSTKFFFQLLNLDFSSIKSIFQKYGYQYEAFFRVASFYSEIPKSKYDLACKESANSVNVYPEFLDFFKALKYQVEFIVITSGIRKVWENILKNNQLDFVHLLGGNYFPTDQYIVDKHAKGIIANKFKQYGKQVFAFGDSLVDFEMLSIADDATLIVNEKNNKYFIPSAHEIPHLKQISFSDFYHPILPVTTLNKIADQISIISQ